MLSSIFRAPKEMLKHAPVYGVLVALTGIQGVLFLLNGDIFATFTEGNVASLLYTADTLLQARALLLILTSLIFSLYSMGFVSRAMRTSSNTKNSLLASSIAFSVIIIVVGLGLFATLRAVNSLSTSGGFATMISTIFMAVMGLIITLCVIKFSFAPTYVGMGLLPKGALVQSWSATQGKLLSMIILLFAVLFVASLIQAGTSIITDPIQDESILSIILFLGSAVGMFYSGTVLALAAPEPNTAASMRSHQKK